MKIKEKWKTNETQQARGAEHKQRGANRRDGAENKADGRSATSVSGLEQGRREGKREGILGHAKDLEDAYMKGDTKRYGQRESTCEKEE